MSVDLARAIGTLMATDDYEVIARGDTWADLIYVHNEPPHPVIRITTRATLGDDMREVFKPAEYYTPDPGKVFYTLTQEDVGTSFIKTTAGVINAGDVIGRVQAQDVGKRLYRVPTDDGQSYVWQVENNGQRDARLGLSD